MIRFHLTDEDLARVRIKDRASPLTEAVLSVEALKQRRDRLAFDAWRATTRHHLSHTAAALLTLIRPNHLWPEFLAPRGAFDIDTGLEMLRRTGHRRLTASLTRLSGLIRLPEPATTLIRHPAQVTKLADAMHDYLQTAIVPHWPRIQAQIESDRAVHAHIMAAAGVHELLRTLHPHIRWRPPILHVPSPMDADIHLGGRGLTLVPSFFNRTDPPHSPPSPTTAAPQAN